MDMASVATVRANLATAASLAIARVCKEIRLAVARDADTLIRPENAHFVPGRASGVSIVGLPT